MGVFVQTLPVTQGSRPFAAFFLEHHARLVRACLVLSGDPAEAEDLAQEAMARALERWDRISGMADPEAQREALALVGWLGYTAEEAGALLGIDAASVRGRLHRARRTLRERHGGPDG